MDQPASQGSVYCSSRQTKAFQNCKMLPHSIDWSFPTWSCSHSRIRRLMCSTQVHGSLFQICVYSTRDLVCLSLGSKVHLSVCAGTCFMLRGMWDLKRKGGFSFPVSGLSLSSNSSFHLLFAKGTAGSE